MAQQRYQFQKCATTEVYQQSLKSKLSFSAQLYTTF